MAAATTTAGAGSTGPVPLLSGTGDLRPMALDFLVFGPHPDDAEIGAGGLLHKMKSLGHSTRSEERRVGKECCR